MEGVVIIERNAKDKIEALMAKFPDTEWLAFLDGRETEEGFLITDLRIPLQSVSVADCDDVEFVPSASHIGVIHSHHTMGAFFSFTDKKYLNSSNTVSVVVAKKGNGAIEAQAVLRLVTPSGRWVKVEAEVVYDSLALNAVAWVEENAGRIKRRPELTPLLKTGWEGGRLPSWEDDDEFEITVAFGNTKCLECEADIKIGDKCASVGWLRSIDWENKLCLACAGKAEVKREYVLN